VVPDFKELQSRLQIVPLYANTSSNRRDLPVFVGRCLQLAEEQSNSAHYMQHTASVSHQNSINRTPAIFLWPHNLKHLPFYTQGRAIVQAVHCRFRTAAARVRAQVMSWTIWHCQFSLYRLLHTHHLSSVVGKIDQWPTY
jgi:hypothetical protein